MRGTINAVVSKLSFRFKFQLRTESPVTALLLMVNTFSSASSRTLNTRGIGSAAQFACAQEGAPYSH